LTEALDFSTLKSESGNTRVFVMKRSGLTKYEIDSNYIEGVFEIDTTDSKIFYKFPQNKSGLVGYDANKSELLFDNKTTLKVAEYYDQPSDVHLFMVDKIKDKRDFGLDAKHKQIVMKNDQ
jgi:hypothetical protein